MGWVADAMALCLAKDSQTQYVSVWHDAGYRCYKGSCAAGGATNVKTFGIVAP